MANIFIVLCLLALIACLFVGCSSEESNESVTTSEISSAVNIKVVNTEKFNHSENEIMSKAYMYLEAETKYCPTDFKCVYIDVIDDELNDKVYVVDFAVDEYTLGGDVAIYIDENTLSFLKVEFGE